MGCEVHALGRTPVATPGVTFDRIDLLDTARADWNRVAAIEADFLVHAAWIAEPGAFWASPQNLEWVAASLKLLDAFTRGGGRRAVFVGTCAEYKWGPGLLEEDATPLEPSTLYGSCKAALHRMVAAAAKPLDLSYAWAHLFFPYGPGEKPGRLLSDVIRRAMRGEPVDCTEGRQIRDFIHVQDAANAICRLLASDLEGSVNIASGDARPIREVVRIAADIVGRPELIRFGALPTRPEDPACIAASVGRLRDELGFRSQYTLEAGVEATIEWWRKQNAHLRAS
jgi:nucleoside-diphosphate-sugar epimerase